MQGNWTFQYDYSKWDLSQDNKGNVSGTVTEMGCQVPLTGTISGNAFTITATGFNSCPGGGVTWLTFAGWVGQPGCNYAYGNWTNSYGNSGGFGQDNPYPTEPYGIFTKGVDVPTGETSTVPPPAAWNANQAAPWNQTVAPNSPVHEFEGRGVYEYSGGVGTDTCWFAGSKWPIYNSITRPGFAWVVSSKNTWGADWIGWKLAAAQYYQANGRAPCASSFQQQMVIDAAYSPDNTPAYGSYLDQYGNLFYGVPYEVNSLGGGITAAAATSVRNGETSTNTTW
jgi:hypothetical protein